MVLAENRTTGEHKRFSDAHWEKLFKSKITHPWIKVDELAAHNKITSGRAVEIPADVLNFKARANEPQTDSSGVVGAVKPKGGK